MVCFLVHSFLGGFLGEEFWGVCWMVLKHIVTFERFIVSIKRYYEGFRVSYKNV